MLNVMDVHYVIAGLAVGTFGFLVTIAPPWSRDWGWRRRLLASTEVGVLVGVVTSVSVLLVQDGHRGVVRWLSVIFFVLLWLRRMRHDIEDQSREEGKECLGPATLLDTPTDEHCSPEDLHRVH